MGRRSALITVVVTLVVAWGSLLLVVLTDTTPRLGLDLQGGFSVVLEAPEGTDTDVLDKAVDIMTRRIEALGGVQEPEIAVVDDRNIEVQLPGVTDRERARAAVGTTGQLEFRPVLDTSPFPDVSPLVLAAEDLRAAEAEPPEDTTTTTAEGAGEGTTTTSTTVAETTTTTTTVPEPLDLTTVLPDGISLCDAGTAIDQQPGCVDPETGLTLNDDPLLPAWLSDPASGVVFSLAPACSEADREAGDCTTDNALLGGDLSGASAQFQQSGSSSGLLGVSGGGVGEWVVVLDFNSAGGDKFAQITKELAAYPLNTPQRQFAIVLDGDVISAPQMAESITPDQGITGGSAIITLGGSADPEAEARDLAVVLRYGALPVAFETSTEQSVSATLGSDSLQAGLIAGIGGLALVALAMILYYRSLGLVNVLGLTVFGSLVYVAFGVLGASSGVTLTLAGVAGVIVSVGITSDSYIVYFERIKEEVHKGRSLRAAIDHAFGRAFRTILIADTVSFAAAIILFFLAIGSVKGFALALGIATVADVLVAYFFTRPAVALVARTRLGEGGRLSIRGATGEAKEVIA